LQQVAGHLGWFRALISTKGFGSWRIRGQRRKHQITRGNLDYQPRNAPAAISINRGDIVRLRFRGWDCHHRGHRRGEKARRHSRKWYYANLQKRVKVRATLWA